MPTFHISILKLILDTLLLPIYCYLVKNNLRRQGEINDDSNEYFFS